MKILKIFLRTGSKGQWGWWEESIDNIPATSSFLKDPTGIALDSAGNLYIADAGNYRIRKVDTEGIITTIAGLYIYIYIYCVVPTLYTSFMNIFYK
jgi:DNA-binding beta-propeller fold protein YncE